MFTFTIVHAQQSTAESPVQSTATNTTAFTYKIIDTENHTYGYDVFADGKLLIHQTSIPAIQGNDGFKSKEDATKVADLVIGKIKKGIMPPTVSIDELKKLKVIK
jgi:hypothetical protein